MDLLATLDVACIAVASITRDGGGDDEGGHGGGDEESWAEEHSGKICKECRCGKECCWCAGTVENLGRWSMERRREMGLHLYVFSTLAVELLWYIDQGQKHRSRSNNFLARNFSNGETDLLGAWHRLPKRGTLGDVSRNFTSWTHRNKFF
jgi:hypothetical protein